MTTRRVSGRHLRQGVAGGWCRPGGRERNCPRMSRGAINLRKKRHSLPFAMRDTHLSTGIIATLTIMLFTESWRLRRNIGLAVRKAFDWTYTMQSLKITLGILAAGLLLSGCMETATYEATNTSNFKPRDKELLAKVRYENVQPAESYRRAIVDFHRREPPGPSWAIPTTIISLSCLQ